MSNDLLEIEPRELKFIVELKKQSWCAVGLSNKSNHYVAFKIKTTSPKKYSVKPNTGIIEPKSTCNFKVTMQAQQTGPLDMVSKDKFLIQSTVVSASTKEEDITSDMFTKEDNRYVEERKLRVILVSPPHSPVLTPINGANDQLPVYGTSAVKDQFLHGNESISSQLKVTQDLVMPKVENANARVAAKDLDLNPVNHAEKLELVRDITNLKSKISELEIKLNEAQITVSDLTEERRLITQDCESLQQELALLRSKKGVRRVQVGFPFLFVCMVALIGLVIGYLLRRR